MSSATQLFHRLAMHVRLKGCVLDEAVRAKQVAQQVLEMAPQASAGQCPGPLPSELQHFHMQCFCQAVQSLHLQPIPAASMQTCSVCIQAGMQPLALCL